MKKINLKLLFLFVATVGLLVFLHTIGWLRPVEKGFYLVINPFATQLHSWSSSLSLFYKRQTYKGELFMEKEELKRKVEELTVANAALRKLEEENSKLRQYFKFFEEKEKKNYVLANVVSREAFGEREEGRGELIINKGLSDGLYEGLAVLNERGVVAGKISSCEEKVCRVVLITNAGSRFAVSLQNKNQSLGVAVGNLGLTIRLNFVPQSEEVNQGDIVVTSGLEKNIPRGLVIGQVTAVEKGSNEIWQEVAVEPLVDFDRLVIVAVLLP